MKFTSRQAVSNQSSIATGLNIEKIPSETFSAKTNINLFISSDATEEPEQVNLQSRRINPLRAVV